MDRIPFTHEKFTRFLIVEKAGNIGFLSLKKELHLATKIEIYF
jgi:hypothetical protein